MIISFYLNGESVQVDVPPHQRAVEFLRNDFQCRSIHRDCSKSGCGTCLILLDEKPVNSCIVPAFELRFRDVWTMEGISVLKGYNDILEGFQAAAAYCCMACAPARALATEALLRQTLKPTAHQVREAADSVRCSCTSKQRARDAILRSLWRRKARLDEE